MQYKIDCRVTIELLDTESEDTEKSVANQQSWSNYVERFANPAAGPLSGNNRNIDGGNISSANRDSCQADKIHNLVSK